MERQALPLLLLVYFSGSTYTNWACAKVVLKGLFRHYHAVELPEVVEPNVHHSLVVSVPGLTYLAAELPALPSAHYV